MFASVVAGTLLVKGEVVVQLALMASALGALNTSARVILNGM